MPLTRRAFTLIELIVVIAIVAIMAALLLPAVQAARETARRTKCLNHLRQMGIALQHYHDSHGVFPAGYLSTAAYNNGQNDTAPGWGWVSTTLPFMEEMPVWSQINFSLPVEHPANMAAVRARLPVLVCPSDILPGGAFAVSNDAGAVVCQAAPASYAACAGDDASELADLTGRGVFFRNSHIRIADITDGTSGTMLVGERAWSNAQAIWAGAPAGGLLARGVQNPNVGGGAEAYPAAALVLAHAHLNNAETDLDGGLDDFSSNHAGGGNFLFADGAARFIKSVPGDDASGEFTLDGLVFQAMGTRAGHEALGQ
jgi:prepilin-type N-terminal cleavage/methylation domain-containing protein/prepilin-type processing-associated H-X9-DG protein